MVEVGQKLSSILAHIPVGTKLADFWPEEHRCASLTKLLLRNLSSTLASNFLYIKLTDFWPKEHRCGRGCSETKFNFSSHPCGHKLADFWPEEHRCGQCCSETKFNFGTCIDATFSNFPLLSEGGSSLLSPMHRWTQYYQTAGQKSVVSTIMQGATKMHFHSILEWSYSRLLSSFMSNRASEPILTLRRTCSTINSSLGTIKCREIRL